MKKSELLKMRLKQVEEKISAAFTAMLDSSSDEDVRAYEHLMDLAKDLKEEIAIEEKKELDEQGIPNDVKDPTNLSEREKFGKKIVEAVAKGTTFSGILPRECAKNIQMKKEKIALIRSLCTVHVASGEYTVWVEGDDVVVDYISEGGAFGETTPSIKGVGLAALKLGALTKVSEEYLADLGVDVMEYIEDKFAKAFAVKEDKEILFGKGTTSDKTKIRGITSNTSVAVVTTASATDFTWEELKQTIQKIKSYRTNARLVCSTEFLDIVHSFKDGDSYMFPQQQRITQIRGIPVVESDVFPTIGSEAIACVIGDFSYYHICDRQSVELRTLNEAYAANGQVGIRGMERIDGDLTLPQAFAYMKMKKSV